MAQAKAQFATAVSARPHAAPKSKPTILIADDSIDGREMLTTLLGLKGYDVLSVENGARNSVPANSTQGARSNSGICVAHVRSPVGTKS